jgi:hypothetical protein
MASTGLLFPGLLRCQPPDNPPNFLILEHLTRIPIRHAPNIGIGIKL